MASLAVGLVLGGGKCELLDGEDAGSGALVHRRSEGPLLHGVECGGRKFRAVGADHGGGVHLTILIDEEGDGGGSRDVLLLQLGGVLRCHEVKDFGRGIELAELGEGHSVLGFLTIQEGVHGLLEIALHDEQALAAEIDAQVEALGQGGGIGGGAELPAGDRAFGGLGEFGPAVSADEGLEQGAVGGHEQLRLGVALGDALVAQLGGVDRFDVAFDTEGLGESLRGVARLSLGDDGLRNGCGSE